MHRESACLSRDLTQLCEGHTRVWQDILRDQPGAASDVDVVRVADSSSLALIDSAKQDGSRTVTPVFHVVSGVWHCEQAVFARMRQRAVLVRAGVLGRMVQPGHNF